MRASAKSAPPRNSLIRLDKLDSAKFPPAASDLHQNRQHEGPPPRSLLEKSPQLHPQLFGHQPLVCALLDPRRTDAFGNHARRVAEQRIRFAFADDEPAGDELGVADERARLAIDR